MHRVEFIDIDWSRFIVFLDQIHLLPHSLDPLTRVAGVGIGRCVARARRVADGAGGHGERSGLQVLLK